MKPVLVGVDNPYGSDPKFALYIEPRYSAGGRLYRIIKAARPTLRPMQYLQGFDRRNLSEYPCPKSIAARRELWEALLADVDREHVVTLQEGPRPPIICVGSVVRDAAGIGKQKRIWLDPETRLGWIPHPSGRNTEMNKASVRRAVGFFLSELLGPES